MLKQRIIDAYNFAQTKHEGQTRKFTGTPYFRHPKGVARIIEDLTRDEDMIIAALLHDTVEDCGVSIETIRQRFGLQVAAYVDELTSKKEEYEAAGGKAKYLAKKMWKMSDNTLVLKLADRIDNLRYADKDCKTLEHKEFVRKYYNETREIFDEICQRGYSENTSNQALIFLMNALHVELEFLRIKYLWK